MGKSIQGNQAVAKSTKSEVWCFINALKTVTAEDLTTGMFKITAELKVDCKLSRRAVHDATCFKFCTGIPKTSDRVHEI